MVRFPDTRNQIEDLDAHIRRQTGTHRLQQQTVSVGGLDVGSMDFDPVRHMPHQIDPLSVMQDVFGTEQVRIQLPSNPMLVSLVGDYRFEGDSPAVAAMKSKAVDNIVEGLVEVIPNLDRSETYKITSNGPETPESLEEDEAKLLDLCSQGLCFVISDFRKLSLKSTFSPNADVLAIKVNHPAEREVLPNVGWLTLGGLPEVNTGNMREVANLNHLLGSMHEAALGRLERAGALTASVILSPHSPTAIEDMRTDAAIASLVKQIQ